MEHKKVSFLPLPFKRVRMNMIFFFSVLILCSLFVYLGISIQVTEEAVLENSTEYTKQLIGQVNTDIDVYISYMENISTMVISSMDIREFLYNTHMENEREEALRSRILSQFETILNMREDIYNIGIYGEDDRMIFNRGNQSINPNVNVKEMEWYVKAVRADGRRVLSSSHVQNIINDDYKWVVTLSKAIRTKETGEVLGALLVDLNYSSITNLCQKINMGNKGYIFLLDEKGEVIYHPKQQLIYTGLKREKISEIRACKDDHFITTVDNEAKLYTMSTSEKTGWTVVGVANIDELVTNKEKTQKIYFFNATLLLLAAVIVAFFFSDQLTKPITELRKSMKKVEKGNFEDILLQDLGDSEIGMLYRSFNIMTDEIQNLMHDKMKHQKEKYKLELRVLQSQINPHFLYNTLDSIVWMAEGGKTSEVVIMTSSLAKLLRQSISNEEEFITIEKEIGYVRSYLTIQKMRYMDQLNYEIEVDKTIDRYQIVKLTLQPLVENAIYHGIKYRETKGTIRIVGYESGDDIIIQVIDNGIGMDEEKLKHLFDKREKSKKSNGIAIENVNRRLKLYYGEDYGLFYDSKVNVGTTVTIVIPKGEGEQLDE